MVLLRKLLVVIGIAMIVVLLLIPGFLGPDDLTGCGDRPDPNSARCSSVDVIVAVSGGDTPARTKEAIQLYKNGWGKKLLFSGAALDKSGPSNADVMARQARDAGVPAGDILTENRAENTEENAEESRAILEAQNARRILVVTSGYHQRRASMEFRAQLGPSVEVLNHPAKSDDGWNQFWWLTPTGWWLALGELSKIVYLMSQGVAP